MAKNSCGTRRASAGFHRDKPQRNRCRPSCLPIICTTEGCTTWVWALRSSARPRCVPAASHRVQRLVLSTLATCFAIVLPLPVALTFFGGLLPTFAVSPGLLIGFPIPVCLLSAFSTCFGALVIPTRPRIARESGQPTSGYEDSPPR
jgi:hypothetical protein